LATLQNGEFSGLPGLINVPLISPGGHHLLELFIQRLRPPFNPSSKASLIKLARFGVDVDVRCSGRQIAGPLPWFMLAATCSAVYHHYLVRSPAGRICAVGTCHHL
jgi:hypothetical protein